MDGIQALRVRARVPTDGAAGSAAGLGGGIGDLVVNGIASGAVEGVEQVEPVAGLMDGDLALAGARLGGAVAADHAGHGVAVEDAAVDADVVVVVADHGAREVALPAQRRRQVREEVQVQGVVPPAPRRVQVRHVRVVVPDRAAFHVEPRADHVVHHPRRVDVAELEPVREVCVVQDLEL